MVECLPGLPKALGSSPSTTKQTNTKIKSTFGAGEGTHGLAHDKACALPPSYTSNPRAHLLNDITRNLNEETEWVGSGGAFQASHSFKMTVC